MNLTTKFLGSKSGLAVGMGLTAAIAGTAIHEINGPHFAEAEGCTLSHEESVQLINDSIAGKTITRKPGCDAPPIPTASPAAPGTEPIALEPAVIEALAQPTEQPPATSPQPSPATRKVSAVLDNAVAYGTGNGLTHEQSIAIQSIAMPQSYGAITRRFGYPDRRDSDADYYQLADGRWARLAYTGTQATWLGISN